MNWGGEVIGHAVLLSCPVAACYAARALARLVAQRGVCSATLRLHWSSATPRRCFSHHPEPKRFREEDGVLQYSNATFSYEHAVEDASEDAEGEEDELEFYMLTPQQAQGALGEHATQFKKIYINGLNGDYLVEQSDEQGAVLSLSPDEYACRIQSVVGGLSSPDSLSTSSSPSCLTPTATGTGTGCFPEELEERTSCTTDGGASCSLAAPTACPSAASSMTYLFAPSERNSLDVAAASAFASSLSSSLASELRLAQGSAEGMCNIALSVKVPRPISVAVANPIPDPTAAPPRTPAGSDLTLTSLGHSHSWSARFSDSHLASAAVPEFGSSAPNLLATQATCTAVISCTIRPGRKTLCPGKPAASSAAAAAAESLPVAESPSGRTRRAAGEHFSRRRPSSTSSGFEGSVGVSPRGSVKGDKMSCKRRSGGFGGSSCGHLSPAPLPAPDPRSVARLSPVPMSPASSPPRQEFPAFQLRAYSSVILEKSPCPDLSAGSSDEDNGSEPSCRRLRSAQALYPRPSLGGVSVSSIAASPAAGLSKAPALPLPDGSTDDDTVPPALRYYLAQARAAGGRDDDMEGDEASERSSSGGSSDSERGRGAGVEYVVVSQPGFVKATVEQINTQRVVCCHVTPFAAAKTSRTPRALTPTSSPHK